MYCWQYRSSIVKEAAKCDSRVGIDQSLAVCDLSIQACGAIKKNYQHDYGYPPTWDSRNMASIKDSPRVTNSVEGEFGSGEKHAFTVSDFERKTVLDRTPLANSKPVNFHTAIDAL